MYIIDMSELSYRLVRLIVGKFLVNRPTSKRPRAQTFSRQKDFALKRLRPNVIGPTNIYNLRNFWWKGSKSSRRFVIRQVSFSTSSYPNAMRCLIQGTMVNKEMITNHACRDDKTIL